MTHTTSLANLMTGSAAVSMIECRPLNSVFLSPTLGSDSDTYADIFNAQAEASIEFAKMLSSAQQSLNKPFLEESAY